MIKALKAEKEASEATGNAEQEAAGNEETQ